MLSAKKWLGLGLLLAGAFSNSANSEKHIHKENCDDKELSEILELLEQ